MQLEIIKAIAATAASVIKFIIQVKSLYLGQMQEVRIIV